MSPTTQNAVDAQFAKRAKDIRNVPMINKQESVAQLKAVVGRELIWRDAGRAAGVQSRALLLLLCAPRR